MMNNKKTIAASKTVTFNVEVKRKWVVALRSGQYRQGRLALRTRDNRFSVLGVLLDITYPTRWTQPKAYPDYYGHRNAAADSVCHVLGEPFKKRFGLDYVTVSTLESLNDTCNKSFTELADYIERKL